MPRERTQPDRKAPADIAGCCVQFSRELVERITRKKHISKRHDLMIETHGKTTPLVSRIESKYEPGNMASIFVVNGPAVAEISLFCFF